MSHAWFRSPLPALAAAASLAAALAACGADPACDPIQ